MPSSPFDGPPPDLLPRKNRLAIVTLVTGLTGLVPFAVGFGVAALVQIARRGEAGKGMAVGGLAASALWLVAWSLAVVLAIGSLFSPDRDDAGHIRGSGKVFIATLRVGDCFTGFSGSTGDRLVTALPCRRPHDGEVAAKTRLVDGPYPGERETLRQATDACHKRLTWVRKSRHSDDLELYSLQPDKRAWRDGDREVLCILRYTGPGMLTTPLSATVDGSTRTLAELVPGDCFGKWNNASSVQRRVACTTPHWVQIFAVHVLPAEPFPGRKAVERKAGIACAKSRKTIFKGRRGPEDYSFVYPLKDDWDDGHRKIACLAESVRAPMRRSILPR
ncbi:septum formation family protein [Actinomadura graeca]|uniref:Septum formation family protein n=1 Tax=Actinomadura graeca TaxID=2750812 RepID=A0ABX8R218_9ACTN|nr:DUF4190 domain-containing protein [Actinomadura graeca]QXJ25095.1 septum formation family protein [Actinomadura graeca]